jgi:hypothetical protein
MKSYKKKKEELIYLKEINGLLITAKDVEKEYFLSQNKNNENLKDENEKTNLIENKKSLERQMRSLKYILNNLERNYGFNSPYHEEFNCKIESKENKNMTEEVSNQIIEFYSSKKFNLCYNLWKKYDFQLLLGISEERNFDMIKYLNKLRDRHERRINLIEEIKGQNINKANNNIKSNQNHYINSNVNNNSNMQNSSQMSLNDLYNIKLSENEQILETLKKQIDNIKNKNLSN